MRELRQNQRSHANRSSKVRRAACFSPAAFTLIELLITMAIILILTSMYWGSGARDPEQAILMSDRQVDGLPKEAGQIVFSQTGKPPGSNHKQNGGNFLFCDGHVESSTVRAPFSLVLTQGVVLLNPKP